MGRLTFISRIADGARDKKQQKALAGEFKSFLSSGSGSFLTYASGAGAVGVTLDYSHSDCPKYVLGENFAECAGVVIRDSDRSLFMHVSALALPEITNGIRGYDNVAIPRRTFMDVFYGGLRALQKKELGGRGLEYVGKNADFVGLDLGEFKRKIESGEMSCSVLAGDEDLGYALAVDLSNRANAVSHFDVSGGSVLGVPSFDVDVYNFGRGQKNICVGKNCVFVNRGDRLFKAGVNFPESKRFPLRSSGFKTARGLDGSCS